MDASTGLATKRLIARLFRSLLASLALFGLARAAEAAEPIRIAVAGPLTGPQAATTAAMADGARAAAKVIEGTPKQALSNFAPGPYEITFKDDGCEAAKAEEAAKQIVAEGFDLVLGHPCPKAALAAAKVYGPAGITFIATETRHPDLTAKRAGASIFRLAGRDDAQGLDAARILARDFKDKKIAVVHDRTLYAKTITEQATAGLKALKIEPVSATIVAGDKEYGKLAGKIKGADVLFFAGFPLEAGFIMQGLRAAGSKAVLLATDSIATDEFTSSFPDVAKEAFILQPFVMNSPQGVVSGITTAVRLYAHARANTAGPYTDAASYRAMLNTALRRYRGPAQATATGGPAGSGPGITPPEDLWNIVFDEAGNASVDSYGLVRWTGERWTPVPSMR